MTRKDDVRAVEVEDLCDCCQKERWVQQRHSGNSTLLAYQRCFPCRMYCGRPSNDQPPRHRERTA